MTHLGLCLHQAIKTGKSVIQPCQGSVPRRVPKTPRQSTLLQPDTPLPLFALSCWSSTFPSKRKRCSLAPGSTQHNHAKSNRRWTPLFFWPCWLGRVFRKLICREFGTSFPWPTVVFVLLFRALCFLTWCKTLPCFSALRLSGLAHTINWRSCLYVFHQPT